MKINRTSSLLSMSLFAVVVMLTVPMLGVAQNKELDPFVGNYRGTARMSTGEMSVTLETKLVEGKLAGRAVAADTEYKVASGTVTGGVITITFGTGADIATLKLKTSGDKLTGDWVKGEQKGTVELTRFDPSADVISGEWDAVADAQGQPFPFTLTMKLEGEKVTGSSSSQLGNTAFSQGSWKDGKLSIVMEGGRGQIALVAVMIEGKLSGEYDFAGQTSGKWIAIKKK